MRNCGCNGVTRDETSASWVLMFGQLRADILSNNREISQWIGKAMTSQRTGRAHHMHSMYRADLTWPFKGISYPFLNGQVWSSVGEHTLEIFQHKQSCMCLENIDQDASSQYWCKLSEKFLTDEDRVSRIQVEPLNNAKDPHKVLKGAKVNQSTWIRKKSCRLIKKDKEEYK